MVICKTCGKDFSHISNHWNYYESHRPKFSERQVEIITGLLMGDGTVSTDPKNPRFSVSMINKEFLEWLDVQLGVLSTGVKKVASASELAERNKKSGFSTTVNEENYHDVYRVSTRTHPQLDSFVKWYSSGGKVWPEELKLTPTVLKCLYVSDGSMAKHGENTRTIHISMSNEIDNLEKVDSYFDSVDLPLPSYNMYVYKDGHRGCDAQFGVDASKELWGHMGDPAPGFEYKWPETFNREKTVNMSGN